MAFDFDALKPEAKKAAFAAMDRRAGGRRKRGSSTAGGGTSSGATDSSQPKARTAQEKIADAYAKLTPDSVGGVSITDLRRKIGGLSREEEDAALKELSRTGKAEIYPLSNRKLLTADDHDAAVLIGNEPNHRIRMVNQPAAPKPRSAADLLASVGGPLTPAEARRRLREQDQRNRDPNRSVATDTGGRITVKAASAKITKSRAAAKMAKRRAQ